MSSRAPDRTYIKFDQFSITNQLKNELVSPWQNISDLMIFQVRINWRMKSLALDRIYMKFDHVLIKKLKLN